MVLKVMNKYKGETREIYAGEIRHLNIIAESSLINATSAFERQ